MNSRLDINFRPWRLLVDPLSEASRDKHFNSAFTHDTNKVWPGEVGVVILDNISLLGIVIQTKDEYFAKAAEEYRELSQIWKSYNRSCYDEECPICKRVEDDNAMGDSDDHQEEDQNEDNKDNEDDGDLEAEDEED